MEHRTTADAASLPDGSERDRRSRPAPAVWSGCSPDPDDCPSVRPQLPAEPRPDEDRIGRQAVRPAASIDDLLPAASAVRDDLRTAGWPLTRDALATRLRAAGYRIGNDRLTPLLVALKDAAAT
jgi:hypothetical protein